MELLFWKTTRDATEVVEGYNAETDNKKVSRSLWTETQEDELRTLFMEHQTNKYPQGTPLLTPYPLQPLPAPESYDLRVFFHAQLSRLFSDLPRVTISYILFQFAADWIIYSIGGNDLSTFENASACTRVRVNSISFFVVRKVNVEDFSCFTV